MHKIPHLNIILVILFVLIGASIGYAGWKSLSTGQGVKNLSTNSAQHQGYHVESATNKNSDLDTFDTSDWKTYRNEKYGFELGYPNEWQIEEMSIYPFGITISPSKNDSVILIIYPIN